MPLLDHYQGAVSVWREAVARSLIQRVQVVVTTAILVTLLSLSLQAQAETFFNGRPSLILEGKAARLVVDLGGGSIVDFRLRAQSINPLEFDSGEAAVLKPLGHFLCLDRWGPPSEAEKRNGMFFHGEAARVEWTISRRPARKGDVVHAAMSALLPLAGLEVERIIRLSDSSASFNVTEAVTNRNKLGRIYNMVQHPTIGPPFLDENTLVDSNARKGFMQTSPLPNPEEPAVFWPQALREGQPLTLRRLSEDSDPNVVSFTFDDELGWVTASSPSQGLLIGYLWKTSEYPWFNAWRHSENGKPAARGLEFGTTGLHHPFPVLVAKGRIFGRPLYVHLDAGQTAKRSYLAFLFKIPDDYQGVARLTYRERRLVIRERGDDADRDLAMLTEEFLP